MLLSRLAPLLLMTVYVQPTKAIQIWPESMIVFFLGQLVEINCIAKAEYCELLLLLRCELGHYFFSRIQPMYKRQIDSIDMFSSRQLDAIGSIAVNQAFPRIVSCRQFFKTIEAPEEIIQKVRRIQPES